MKCHVCGGLLESTVSDLPFNLAARRVVIVREVPVLQCRQCGAYLIEDTVMQRVEETLAQADTKAELEVISYAA